MDVVSRFRKRMLLVVVGCLSVTALISAAVVLGGSVTGTGGKVIASAFLLPLACLFTLAGSAVLERARILGVVTIFANILAALALQAALWTGMANDALGQAAVGIGALAVYGSLVSLLVSRNRAGDTSGVHVAQAVAFSGLGAFTLVVSHWSLSFHQPSHDALKLAGVGAIVGILGVIATPMVRAANPGPGTPEPDLTRGVVESLIGMRVVAVSGTARNELVFENGARVRLH